MKLSILNNEVLGINSDPKIPSIEHSEDSNKLEEKCLWLICPRCKEFPIISQKITNVNSDLNQEEGMITIKCRCNKYNEFLISIKEYLSLIKEKQKENNKCTKEHSHSVYQAIDYCFQCQVFMCSVCHNIHKTLYENHMVSKEGICIDKICDRHLTNNKIVSYCAECRMNLCPTCLKDHNIHHQVYDMQEIFPKSLFEKSFSEFNDIKINYFEIINESKKNMEEKILGNKEGSEEEKNEIQNLVNQMNNAFNNANKINKDFVNLISLMFDNYINTIDSTPNYNISYNLKNGSRFNTGIKPFVIDESIPLIENLKNFIFYLKSKYIIKTINTPLKIKEKVEIKGLNNIRSLLALPGNRICIGNWETDIHILDLNSRQIVNTLKGHFSGINSLCFINKKFILSGGKDFAMNLYDIANNSEDEITTQISEREEIHYRGFLSGHDGNVSKIIQLKDGKILTCGWDKKINVFGKIKENEEKENLPQIVENEENAEENKTNKDVSNLSHLTEKEKEIERIKDIKKNNLNLIKKEQVENKEKKENVKYYNTFEEIKSFSSHKDKVYDIVELKDGSIMSCSNDKTLKVFSMDTLKEIKTIPVNFYPRKLICLKDGRICIGYKKINTNDYCVGIFTINENYEITLQKEFCEHKEIIYSLEKLDDGKVVSTDIGGNAVFYNPFDLNKICTITQNENKGMTSVIEMENKIVIIGSGYNYLYILE